MMKMQMLIALEDGDLAGVPEAVLVSFPERLYRDVRRLDSQIEALLESHNVVEALVVELNSSLFNFEWFWEVYLAKGKQDIFDRFHCLAIRDTIEVEGRKVVDGIRQPKAIYVAQQIIFSAVLEIKPEYPKVSSWPLMAYCFGPTLHRNASA